jgi:preprotein translocase subunit Sec61beta
MGRTEDVTSFYVVDPLARDLGNVEHSKRRFIVLESDSSLARAPHRYKIVIAAHTFSPWYCKAKEPDVPENAGIPEEKYRRKMRAGDGVVRLIEEIAENEIPLSWRIVQFAWLAIIPVVDKQPSLFVQRVRPVDIREARFQHQ